MRNALQTSETADVAFDLGSVRDNLIPQGYGARQRRCAEQEGSKVQQEWISVPLGLILIAHEALAFLGLNPMREKLRQALIRNCLRFCALKERPDKHPAAGEKRTEIMPCVSTARDALVRLSP